MPRWMDILQTILRRFGGAQFPIQQWKGQALDHFKNKITSADWLFLFSFGGFAVLIILELVYWLFNIASMAFSPVAGFVQSFPVTTDITGIVQYVLNGVSVLLNSIGSMFSISLTAFLFWGFGIFLAITAFVLWGKNVLNRFMRASAANQSVSVMVWLLFVLGIGLHLASFWV